jgi:hypothetical protein
MIYGTGSKSRWEAETTAGEAARSNALEHVCVNRVGGTVKWEFQEVPEHAFEIQVKSALERTSGKKKNSEQVEKHE